MVLFIDNYDSFTYNLVQYFGEINPDIKVIRNDELSIEEILNLKPSHVVLSPGPCTPNEAGICLELCLKLPAEIPLLGICLGHQALGQAYGSLVTKGKLPIHGKTSPILHAGNYLFKGLPSPFNVVRYHSLIVDKANLSPDLEIISESQDGVIMGLKHRSKPHFGLQFHPESFHTQYGKEIIQNFLNLRPYDC